MNMNSQPTPKVIGAFVIGFALVAGAYVFSNFGQPTGNYRTTQNLNAERQVAAARVAIPVTDNDNNGIEDWRDEFVSLDPIVLQESVAGEVYESPQTLTGQTGVNFVQNIIRSRNTSGFYAGSDDEVITDTVSALQFETSVTIYDTPDIMILTNWDNSSIKNYANAAASAIIDNAESDLDNELLILRDILNRNDQDRLRDLETLAEIYRVTRDTVIDIPVPELLVKEHLDLINTLHAVHNDILGMTLSYDDPAFALFRLKRYEDDVLGLSIALENMYTALIPYASEFSTDDTALYFLNFNPATQEVNRIRI